MMKKYDKIPNMLNYNSRHYPKNKQISFNPPIKERHVTETNWSVLINEIEAMIKN